MTFAATLPTNTSYNTTPLALSPLPVLRRRPPLSVARRRNFPTLVSLSLPSRPISDRSAEFAARVHQSSYCRLHILSLRNMDVMHHSTSFLLPSIPSKDRSSPNYALIVLNQHLPRFTPLLWEHEQQNYECLQMEEPIVHMMSCPNFFLMKMHSMFATGRYKPDVIKGDMDSIRSEVLDFYEVNGAKIIDQSHDQDTTDLHKCVLYIQNFARESELLDLYVLVTGAVGGRFDHEAGNINVLYRFSNMRIILLSDDCLIHLLPIGHHHKIHIEPSIVGPHCGLIPIGAPSGHSTTTGLKWNLTDTAMEFGGLVSTSNIVEEDTVTVQSDSDLLWTISIKQPSGLLSS
ncbi:Thiamine pyrophosphokinase 1-like protein [Drosera capensis]